MRVHLQEDCCIYRHGIVCFTFTFLSGLIGRRVYSVDVVIINSCFLSGFCILSQVCSYSMNLFFNEKFYREDGLFGVTFCVSKFTCQLLYSVLISI